MSQPKGIEKVIATCFRGASRTTEIAFDASKRFVLLYGENGSGKSTIIDAIDVVCNQHGGSIMERSQTKVKEHLPTIGSKDSDVRVSIEQGGKRWNAAISGSKITVNPSVNIPSATILRRGRILGLIETTPSERFNQLKSFIEVDLVQKSEDELGRAIKESERGFQERTRALEAALSSLEKAHKSEQAPEEVGMTPEEWGKKRSEADLSQVGATLTKLKSIGESFAAVGQQIQTKNKDKKDLDERRKRRDEVKENIEKSGSIDAQTGLILVELLSKAGEYIAKEENLEKCPVCLTSLDATPSLDAKRLREDIASRLVQMSALDRLAKEWKKVQDDEKAAGETARKSYTSLIDNSVKLIGLIKLLEPAHRALLKWNESASPNLTAWPGKLTKEVIAECDAFLSLMPAFSEKIGKIQETLQKQKDQLQLIKQAYDEVKKARKSAQREGLAQAVLEKMLATARRLRIAFTQNFLDDIADECDRLYSEIHPGEKTGGVRFVLDQQKKASLDQIGMFEDHPDILPQAYFSDSHLDTLGFCAFMAVTKKATNGNTTVVLDDVFGSVDIKHIQRILLLLMKEAKSFGQIILATQQRRWLNLFEINIAPVHEACLVQLRPWRLDTGVCADRVVPYIDQLEDVLDRIPLNRREVGALSGFIIEGILGEMTKHLECSVKRNPRDKPTGPDLLDAFKKRTRGLKIQQSAPSEKPIRFVGSSQNETADLESVVTDLKQLLPDGRNTVGDHFNWDAADISDETIHDFGGRTLQLARLLICNGCGGMAIKDKKSHLECGCGKLTVVRGQ